AVMRISAVTKSLSLTGSAGSAEVHVAVEAHGEARMGGDLAHAEQHAGHEADAVEGVVAQGELLPLPAELDDLVGDQPALTHGVHVDAVHHGPTRNAGILLGGIEDWAAYGSEHV